MHNPAPIEPSGRDAVASAYAALATYDFRLLSELLHDQVVVHVGGTSRHAGVIEGKEAVLMALSAMFSDFRGRLSLEVVDVASYGDEFVVTLCCIRTPFDVGAPETVSAHMHRVEEGRIVEAWFQPLDASR